MPGRISRRVRNLSNATTIANVRLVDVDQGSLIRAIDTNECYYLTEWSESSIGAPVPPIGPTDFQFMPNGSVDAAPVVYLANSPALNGSNPLAEGPTPSKCIFAIRVQKLRNLFLLQST